MDIRIVPIHRDQLGSWRQKFRSSVSCQIVRDSIIARGLADPFAILVHDQMIGYAGVWNQYNPGRLMEIFVDPRFRTAAELVLSKIPRVTGATHVEAQTNIPFMSEAFTHLAAEVVVEKTLFADKHVTNLLVNGVSFRERRPGDAGPEGRWVVTLEGRQVGGGGFLTHYNPPFADIYMEVVSEYRRRGIGSFFVQELRRACKNAGYTPAARCNPDNLASENTLLKGGMEICGHILTGRIKDRYLVS